MSTTPPDPAAVLAGDTDPAYHPSATEDQLALLRWADAHEIERPRLDVNGNGQYHAPTPRAKVSVKGNWKGRTRVTTFCDALEDSSGLEVWRQGLLAAGIVSSDELVAQVRRAVSAIDAAKAADDSAAVGKAKGALKGSIAAALHWSGEKLKANIGTALHLAMEHAVMGTGERPPDPWGADVDAALLAMEAAGLHVQPHLLERQFWIPAHGGLVGTGDLLVETKWSDDLRVADYKTGGNGYDRIGYALQNYLYSRAEYMWRLDGEGWEPTPNIDQEVGYLISMPAGTGTATVVDVDLKAAAKLAPLAEQVRKARTASEVRALFHVNAAAPSDTEAKLEETLAAGAAAGLAAVNEEVAERNFAERTAWVQGRLKAITDPEQRDRVRAGWPMTAPAKPPWSEEELNEIDLLLHHVEDSWPSPAPAPAEPVTLLEPEPEPAELPHPRTWDVEDDGQKPSPEMEQAVATAFQALPDGPKATLKEWVGDAKRSGHPFSLPAEARTLRTVEIQAATVSALGALWDSDEPDLMTRLVLAEILKTPLPDTWSTGAVLGTLSTTAALELHKISDAFLASDPNVTDFVGRLVSRHFAG